MAVLVEPHLGSISWDYQQLQVIPLQQYQSMQLGKKSGLYQEETLVSGGKVLNQVP